MNIAQLMPIYNITVHEYKIYVALNVVGLLKMKKNCFTEKAPLSLQEK